MATEKKVPIQKLVLDLSGRGGLANKFAGDIGAYSSSILSNFTNGVNNRYLADDDQFVTGTFNPVKKYGYMSPSVATLLTTTPAVSFTALIAATQVDELNSDVYFFEASTKIQRATGLSDLTLTDDRTITNAVGTDLAIYTVNGNRSLFYAYRGLTNSKIGVKDITATSSPTFTVDASTDLITYTGGGWTPWDGRAVMFTTTTTLPAGLSLNTLYYIRDTDLNNTRFKVSSTVGGGAVDITGTGTGTHSISLFIDDWQATAVVGFFAATLSTTKMITSGDGFMYVLTKNTVHRVDGTAIGGANGTIYPNILTAPEYFYFSHGIDLRSNLYLVVQRNNLYQTVTDNTTMLSSECGVYIWNRQSTFFNTSDFIPLPGVREVRAIFIAPNGKVRVICLASDKTVQIREYNGSSFTLIKTLGYQAAPQYEDSVAVAGNFTVWLGKDGNLYYYGSDIAGEKEFLFIAGNLGTINAAQTGAIAYAASGVTLSSEENKDGFYVSWKDNSATYLKVIRPFAGSSLNGSNVLALQGDVYTAVKILPRLSTVKHVDVYLAQYPHVSSLTTDAGTVKVYFNNSSTAWASKTVTRGDIAKGFFPIEVNKPYVNSIQLEFEFPTGQTVEENIMNPAFAVVEYVATGTIK